MTAATADQHPSRRVPLPSAPNMRDLGGLPVRGGAVRTGEVFRSASVAKLSDDDQDAFGGLGIATVYDLRTARERAKDPDRLPATIPSVHLDVMADDEADTTAGLTVLRGDASRVAEVLRNGGAIRKMEESYRKFVGLDSARAAYRDFFLALADGSRRGAALFHCATGKDRTGWAAATLLRILGADEDAVLADYLQTNTDLLPALQTVLDKAEADGLDPDLLLPILGVRESYLEAADDEVHRVFGGFEDYLSEGLGLDGSTREALQERFVE